MHVNSTTMMFYITASMKFSQTGTGDDAGNDVLIDLNDPCTLTFALKYLSYFAKAAPLSEQVTLSLSQDIPLGMQYYEYCILGRCS